MPDLKKSWRIKPRLRDGTVKGVKRMRRLRIVFSSELKFKRSVVKAITAQGFSKQHYLSVDVQAA